MPTLRKSPDIIFAIRNPELFGALPAFKKSQSSWAAWIIWLKSVFALPLDANELAVYRRCTGRENPVAIPLKEFAVIVGRRAGKSFISALVAVYVAAFQDFQSYLTAGETGMVVILARDRDQAKVVFGYVRGILHAVPVLCSLIAAERTGEIELTNGIVIVVKTSDYRSIRGVTVVCAIGDEIAFWDSEGVSPDKETITALRPAMATIPTAKLILISSGYARAGVLFDLHREFFGKDAAPCLVWQAPTREMNPTISQEFIDGEIERDPDAARAEWLGGFRENVSLAFPIEMIEASIIPGRIELPPSSAISYYAFSDVSGGRTDLWGLAISHTEGDIAVLDLLRYWSPPLSPSTVCVEVAAIMRSYGINLTVGDNYGGEWPVDAFSKAGIDYTRCELPKSDLYLWAIPQFCSKRVELLDNALLTKQLRRLERRRGRTGKDSIDHPGATGDDLANSAIGALWLAGQGFVFQMPTLFGSRVAYEGSGGQQTIYSRESWIN